MKYICIECRRNECEEGKDGKHHLKCPSCTHSNASKEITFSIFSEGMKLNPKNNYLINQLNDTFYEAIY
jgi:hypothetical protein